MSIDSNPSPQGSDSTTIAGAPCTVTATQDSSSDAVSKAPDEKLQSQSGPASLLTSLWSPFSSMLHISSPNKTGISTETNKDTIQTSTTEQSKPSDSTKEPAPEPEPEPYYTPKTTPTFKRLARLRLSGTREKQLIRAASRAHNDPPPPPGLGMCCGSSCDPCVNELWRQERDTWRERWGDHAIEDNEKDKDQDQDKKKEKKDLAW